MSKPTALELALVAAVLDPALAKAEPERAVRIASKLISTAQKLVDLPGAAERHNQSLVAEAHAAADEIPVAERMTLSDAFNRFGKGHYKTLDGFTAALQNEALTVFPRDGGE